MDTVGNSDVASMVERWLLAGRHETLLAVGTRSASLLAACGTARVHHAPAPPAEPTRWLEDLATHPRFDAALLGEVVERVAEDAAGVVLSRIRDVHCARFLLVVPDEGPGAGPRSRRALLALGLEAVGSAAAEDGVVHLYGYDTASYKRTPDWLNSRYWAHPERWGRARW